MWSELFCRASDNLLSLHFASANVLGHYSRRERAAIGISYGLLPYATSVISIFFAKKSPVGAYLCVRP